MPTSLTVTGTRLVMSAIFARLTQTTTRTKIGSCGDADVCPLRQIQHRMTFDGDGIGDRCDSDVDGDDVENDVDNCPFDPNPGQENSNTSPQGDACENLFFYDDFEDGDLAGWELSGRWVNDETAAFGVDGAWSKGTTGVFVSWRSIHLAHRFDSRAERPRLSFWVRRQPNPSFFVDAFVDQNLNKTFRISAVGRRPLRLSTTLNIMLSTFVDSVAEMVCAFALG